MSEPVALLLTDLVDSAALAVTLGDEAMAQLSAAHDRAARDLLHRWQGQEIDKSDGFLLLFTRAADALGYALAYHRALAALPVPLKARAGLHVGEITLRESPAQDVARGAKPFEVDGVSKPLAARVMGAALGGQTLLTRAALDALGPTPHRVAAHGHWQVKGLPTPLELFEIGEDGAPFTPPPDAAKAWRVVRQADLWLPVRQLRHSLPAERDAFVGRHEALLALARHFDDGTRLVSVLGIGGGGKTRLATRFGWAWMGDFPGGVWFCDLAPARTLEGLCSAAALGLQLPLGPEDPVVQLGQAIAGRGRCLVILDNFEHLSRLAEATLGQWLDRAAEALFLVTTREVLGIAGEATLALAPLPAGDAQSLFVRRATAAQRDFRPSADDEAAIRTLVALLDGLPLAIELAAARVRTLAPRALLGRMSERFKLLTSSGGRLDRQATLRATFDWSWGLLPTAEKAALAQLSVFEGGFTLEAAEAVIDLSPLEDPPWTLDVVNALVDKSFVRPLGAAEPGQPDRFDLLVSVQAYAHEHLVTEGRYRGSGATALADAQLRHGAWFATLGPRRAANECRADLDNLVLACRRALARGDTAQAVGTLDGAWAVLNLRGPFKAGVELASAVCAVPGLGEGQAARAQAALGGALEAAGQRQAAQRHFEQALAHAQACGDRACEAGVSVRLGGLHARAGRADAARAAHGRALALAQQLGDATLECAALNGLGGLNFEAGRVDDARAHYEAALALAQRTDDRRWQASLRGNLGNLDTTLGRLDSARQHTEAALQSLRCLGDRQREGNTLCNLGMLCLLQGDLDEALGALQQGLVVARELGHLRLECIALGNLGLVHDAAGRLHEAVACFTAALGLTRELGDPRTEGQLLGHQALTRARQGDVADARQALDRARTLLHSVDDTVSLGLLWCQRAETEWLGQQPEAARLALQQAEALAGTCDAGAQSELGVALARVRALAG